MLIGCATNSNNNQEKAMLYVEMANSQISNNNLPAALKDLLTAQSLAPDNPVVQNNLGLVYFLRERYETSEKHFIQAVRLAPKYTDARNNLARVYIELGKFKKAEQELKIVLDDLTYSAQDKAYVNQGLLNFNLKKFQLASDSFKQAIVIQPDNCIAHKMNGRSLFELKLYPAASEALSRAVSFCQGLMDDEPLYYSALTQYRLGNKEKAIVHFEELLKFYPDGFYREKARGMIELIRKGN